MNGENRGETVTVTKRGRNYYYRFNYWQTYYNRTTKKDVLQRIQKAFQEKKNMAMYGDTSFEAEKQKMQNSKKYFFEYWDDKP